MNGFPWLTVLTLLPLFGGLVVIGLRDQQKLARKLTLISSFLALGLTKVGSPASRAGVASFRWRVASPAVMITPSTF